MKYLLDANVFITAKNFYYGFDFCAAFWDWIYQKNNTGKVFSIEKVGDELKSGNDDLSIWAKNLGDAFFIRPDKKILPSLTDISEWIQEQGYDRGAIYEFTQSADYYLIAHANAHSLTVVTHEAPGGSRKKVKIPDICIGMGIKCVTTFAMLRREKARFILG